MSRRTSPSLRLLRSLGKFILFLTRRVRPPTAWWLACHDAPVAQDYRGVPLAALRAAWQAARSWADLAAGSARISSRLLRLDFAGDDVLARHYPVLCDLVRRGFHVQSEASNLILSDGHLAFCISTDEEVSMAREIYLEQCYRFHLEGRWNVLDIGANAGFASLFFAAQPWVARVDAFEPFGPTADAFDANLRRNPTLQEKITLWHHGLGEADATATVDYHPPLRGSMTLSGLGAWRGRVDGKTKKVSVQVRQTSRVLDELRPGFSGRPVLLKIDCEGSEFGILRDLERTGWLSRLDLIVMEWHQHQPDELLAGLSRAGFAQHVRALAPDSTLGLIIAVRRRAAP